MGRELVARRGDKMKLRRIREEIVAKVKRMRKARGAKTMLTTGRECYTAWLTWIRFQASASKYNQRTRSCGAAAQREAKNEQQKKKRQSKIIVTDILRTYCKAWASFVKAERQAGKSSSRHQSCQVV